MMGSSSEVYDEDRISNLPSCLIAHILSLVPTKDAVATSVLSKRWKNLWTLITCLDFSDAVVLKHEDREDALQMSFKNFVYRVLLQCRSLQISKFRLHSYNSYDASHVISWVSTVLGLNVRNIDICVRMEKSVPLPWNIFLSGTLVELKLSSNFVVSLPKSVCLPCLKILHLFGVKLLDESSIFRLIGGCPMLQELSMSRCIGENVKVVNISAPTLKTLDLTLLSWNEVTKVSQIKIVLEAPMLSYLRVYGVVAQCYDLKDLHHLSEASIDVWFENEFDGIGRLESLKRLLEEISKVKVLKLGCWTLEAIVLHKCELPIFQTATELELLPDDGNITLELLPVLLENMPCLTTLTFPEGLGYENGYGETWVPPQVVPDCLSFCLKKVEILDFKGIKNEREIAEYFVKNGKVLEELILHYDLLSIPSGSGICKVKLL